MAGHASEPLDSVQDSEVEPPEATVARPSVYLETSIVSYLVARPSRDLVVAGHQQVTVAWWEEVLPLVDCFVSPFVIQEASRGDQAVARRRLEKIETFPVLEVNETVGGLAQEYFDAMAIPEKSRIDAFHLAMAVSYRIDYLLSWNCRHIASGRVQKLLQRINSRMKIHTPVLCTPEELMEI